MDYEKKYKEALGWMKSLYGGLHGKTKEEAEKYFPELQESEDEKVKRIIHSISNKISFHLHDIFTEEEFQCFDAWSNAWLEKQGQVKESHIFQHNNKTCKENDNFLACKDEKMREAQLDYWRNVDGKEWYGVPVQEVITWLEKQGNVNALIQEAAEKSYTEGMRVERKRWLEKQGEKKPKWTDEDEENMQHCCGAVAAADYYTLEDKEEMTNWLISLKQRIVDNSAKTCKNDTLLDLLQKMPSCITVDGIDYHFVLKKTSIYIAYYACYKGNGEEGRGNAIFGITAHSPIDLLTEMLEKLKEKGLLE